MSMCATPVRFLAPYDVFIRASVSSSRGASKDPKRDGTVSCRAVWGLVGTRSPFQTVGSESCFSVVKRRRRI